MTSDAMTTASTINLSVYYAPEWGSRVVRTAAVSQASDGTYTVDQVPVTEVRRTGLFSLLTCADGMTHIVLTVFLRLVRSDAPAAKAAS